MALQTDLEYQLFAEKLASIDFAVRNCNPAKSHLCIGKSGAGSCIPLTKKCKVPASSQSQQAMSHVAKTATTPKPPLKSKKTTPAAPTPSTLPSPAPANSVVKLNQAELVTKRSELEQKHGKKLVQDAEANVKKILTDDDTSVFVRVGSSDTLSLILNDRFRTSAELNVTSHKIPDLADKNYQDARNRVEAKSLGYDAKTPPSDRPIYGYLGGKNLDGAAHADVADAYGSISVKLKSEVKDRTSFTGSDSFKSGIASKLDDPSAASLASVTRFGYDLNDKNVPAHLRSMSEQAQKGQLQKAANAKSIDDLNQLAPTGKKYIEAQVHGKVTPDDIAEIHFKPRSTNDRPTPEIAKLAKDKGIDLYVNGKKVNPDDIINAKSSRSQRLTDLDTELSSALKSGDFNKVADIASQIDADAKKVKLAPAENDRHLKLLYSEAGYDGKPQVVSKAAIDLAAKDGATLMVRGLNDPSGQFAKDFRQGDYYTGNGIYGNGTYVGHSGSISKGIFTHGSDAASGKRAVADVAKHNYIHSGSRNLRMALPADTSVVTQTQIGKEIIEVQKGIEKWAKAERQNIRTNSADPKRLAKDAKAFKSNLDLGDSATTFIPGKATKVFGIPATEGSLKIPKKDGSGFVEYPVVRTLMGDYYVKDSDGNIGSKVGSKDKAVKRTVKILSEEHGLRAQGLGDQVHLRDVQISRGRSAGSNVATIPGQKDKLALKQDPTGKHYYIDPKTDKSVYGDDGGFDSPQSAVRAYLQSAGLAGGGADPKKIAEIDRKAKAMREVLIGDNGRPPSSGRFAVIRGYDAIALDQSYAKDTFMNLLNRSKVLVQDTDLSYADAMKKGVAP